MFQIKDFSTIARGEIEHARAVQDQLTDFNVGSVVRTILEAPAIEIEEFYQRMLAGVLEAIPVAIYQGFNFSVLDAAPAGGNVILSFGLALENPVTIPEGAIFQNPSTGISYLASDEVVAPAGATSATVPVYASIDGPLGNASANTITVSVGLSLPNNTTIGNVAFFTGRDAETEQERSMRFMAYIASISRGTVAALRYAVSTAVVLSGDGAIAEYVTRVGMVEQRGHVRMYLYSSLGTPSSQLLENAQYIIDGETLVPGYRSAGVRVDALAMAETGVDVDITVTLMPGIEATNYPAIEADIATRLSVLLDSIQDGEVLYVEEIVEQALAASGVRRVITDNDENVICDGRSKLILGTLTVVWDA